MWEDVLLAALLALVAAPIRAPRPRGGHVLRLKCLGLPFVFSLEPHAGEAGTVWRAWIVSQPAYAAGQATDGHATHRKLNVPSGRTFVCWEPEPRTAEEACAAARRWVVYTARYIQTGVS